MNEQQGIKPYVIGLDLGGTNAVFGIVDQRGEIKATTAIKTQQYDTAEAFIEASVNALQPIIDQVGGIEKIRSMGVGAPKTATTTKEPLRLLLTSSGPTTVWYPLARCSVTDWVVSLWLSPTMLTLLLSVRWSMVWHVA